MASTPSADFARATTSEDSVPQALSHAAVKTADQWSRDGAHHQGTVWAWLLGPFALAHYRVHGDAEAARSFLRPLAAYRDDGCIGSIAEIFEGDAPFRPDGCVAQAWSVSETLRAWHELGRAR